MEEQAKLIENFTESDFEMWTAAKSYTERNN